MEKQWSSKALGNRNLRRVLGLVFFYQCPSLEHEHPVVGPKPPFDSKICETCSAQDARELCGAFIQLSILFPDLILSYLITHTSPVQTVHTGL